MDQKAFFTFAKNKLKSYTYPRDTAMHHVTYRVPLAHTSETVLEVRQRLLDNLKQYSTINYIYVTSRSHKLKGVFSYRELFSAAPDAVIKDIMVPKLHLSHPQVDQERIAHLALKHNIKAIPIVDGKNTFLGVVPSDSILNILQQEQHEDLLHFSGIVPAGHHRPVAITDSIFSATLHRSPWILIGVFGGLFTAKIIGRFEATLDTHLVLASFIPLVAYVANAVGTQTQTLYIRDMVFGNVKLVPYAIKQLITTSVIGIFCWLLLLSLGAFLWQSVLLGHVVGLSVIAAIIAATFFALAIPFTLKQLNVDPAVGAGPFATIIQDLLSIILFLTIASLLL